MTKYRPNNLKWQTAWRNILNQHDEGFVNSRFCFQFPTNIKEKKPGTYLEKHQHKLHRKLQREFTRKNRGIKFYLTESLKSFNKAKKRREKRKTQYPIIHKQQED